MNIDVYKETSSRNGKSFKFSFNQSQCQFNKEFIQRTNEKASSLFTIFRDVFLPRGYPQSVSDDYLSYQIWDTIQAFASSISGSLATQAVLKSVGVGEESATPLAATITWLLRHGAGMIGQIIFTWAKGCDLDYNCKKWRLFADILNDSAMMVELSAPYWPNSTQQIVLCSAGVFRSLVGVAGGATRAAITQHQARMNNISDVAAKDGSQETLVNLTALIVNLMILPLISDNVFVTWTLFFLLTFLHIFSNYRAVKSLKFQTLNKERLLHFLNCYFTSSRKNNLSVEETNQKESVILGFGINEKKVIGRTIRFGDSFESLTNLYSDPALINNILKRIKSEHYFVFLNNNQVHVILSNEISDKEMLIAYLDSCLIGKYGENHDKSSEDILDSLQELNYRTDYIQMSNLGWFGDIKKCI